MRVEIFICTYNRDFRFLKYFLRSADKFATGFANISILVPRGDGNELLKVLNDNLRKDSQLSFELLEGDEWPGKGMLWHEDQICRADQLCPKADIICHADPDIVFTEPVTPLTFITADGKPLLRYEPFESIGKRHPGVLKWKTAVENCLPFPVVNEFMRGHCHCYHRETYIKTRELVESKMGFDFDEYVRSCKNDFPQTFAEHPTLGAVAYEFFREAYEPFDCSMQPNPDYCHYPVFQAWSHASPEQEVSLWYHGEQIKIAPIEFYKKLGIA